MSECRCRHPGPGRWGLCVDTYRREDGCRCVCHKASPARAAAQSRQAELLALRRVAEAARLVVAWEDRNELDTDIADLKSALRDLDALKAKQEG